MGLWDAVTRMIALTPVVTESTEATRVRDFWSIRNQAVAESRGVQTRAIDSFTDFPDLTTQLLRIQGLTPRPWRVAGLAEALGVPAIFGAVNLIANLTGSMTMKALRGEQEVPPDERPRLIVRPDPFTIPREFYRSTAYNLATRGETWWWVAARDIDGMAISVINVNPAEVTVFENPLDLRYPQIRWRNVEMRNEDFRQLVYAREPGSLRGHGPLQMCGAAISVAVEAQEWAANFFSSGGNPSVELHSDDPMEVDEAAALKAQWILTPPNTPQVTTGALEVRDHPANEQGAQMLGARAHQNVDVATMFGMDAALLNAAVSGSGITYQNVGSEFEKFLRQCLRPNYLECIEQTMSDFLPRSTVARFNTDAITLADIRTRYDVYSVGIDKGIIDVEEARRFEGLAPGDVENAAVPYSPPQAVPSRLPIQMRSEPPVRCDGRRMLKGVLRPCGKLLAEAGPFIGRCPRCGREYPVAA